MSANRALTYYDLLEVPFSADEAAIKSAYRKLARQFHPDVHPGNPDNDSKFKQINQAYAVLSDPQKRRQYDLTLGIGVKASAQQAKAAYRDNKEPSSTKSATSPGPKPPKQSQVKPNQTDTFKDMFDSLFKKDTKPKPKPEVTPQQKTKQQNKPPVRGKDVETTLVLSREEAEKGLIKPLTLSIGHPCSRCSATGKVNGLVCKVCHGEKQENQSKKLDVRIPAGVKHGSKIRISKEGHKGQDGGESGDLFVLIQFQENQPYVLDGLNVLSDLHLSIPDAVLGKQVDVKTLHGSVTMVIPPQTSSGKVFRLKGQGVKQNGKQGDHLVTIHLDAPKTLSAKEKELYDALRKLQP